MRFGEDAARHAREHERGHVARDSSHERKGQGHKTHVPKEEHLRNGALDVEVDKEVVCTGG
jgi:hypothetical protein